MSSQVKIGWAARDVSTTARVNIPGQMHMRISEGVQDPVTVTALAVESGGDAVIFTAVDSTGISSVVLQEVRALVKAVDESIPVEKILMNATHTHTAPDTADSNYVSDGTIPTEIEVEPGNIYRAFLVRETAGAIVEAWQKRTAGGVGYGYGFAAIGNSRRVLYFDDTSLRPENSKESGILVDGHARMYGNTNDKMFSGYEAGGDHFLNVFFTFDESDELTGCIINIPCPSQSSENIYKISASYWHEIRELIRQEFGDIYILGQAAAAGDLAPRILHYKEAQKRRFKLKYGREESFEDEFVRSDIAQRVLEGFREVYSWAKNDIQKTLEVKHETLTLDLPRRMITEAEYLDQQKNLAELAEKSWITDGDPVACLKANSILCMARKRCQDIIDRYIDQQKDLFHHTEVHVLRIGEVAFASNQFELYMDYMHRIQARSPFAQTFVIQLAATPGSVGTYLPTERARENRGYSACCFDNLVAAEGGQTLVEKTLEILEKIK